MMPKLDMKNFLGKAVHFIRYHLKEKWKFVYFEFPFGSSGFTLPEMDDSLIIRIAEQEDISRIEADIYPFLDPENDYDKRYITRIGDEDFKCFIAERNEKIVHYFLVYENARNSPLYKTPFDKTRIQNSDAYLGSTFTIPGARGLWIVPHTMLKIFEYLKNNTNVTRVMVLVHKDTPGAEGFYRKLGFKEMSDVCSAGPVSFLLNLNKRLA